MKPKRLILWLIILAGAAAAYLLSGETERRVDQEKEKERRAVQLAGILDVESVRLSGRAHPKDIVVKRQPQGQGWLITQPITYPADGMAMSRLVGGVLDARIEKKVDDAGNLASYGLDPARVIIVVRDKGGQEEILLVGDESPTGNYLYAAPPEGGQIWFLPMQADQDLSLNLFDLRDKMVLDFVPGSVDRIEIKGQGEPLTLSRTQEDGRKSWRFSGGEPASSEEVRNLLFNIHGLTTKEFLDGDQDRIRMGLSRPKAEILLSLDGGGQTGLLIGGPAPDSRTYVTRLGQAPVMLVETARLAKLPPSQWDLAQRRILDLKRDQVTGLEMIRDKETQKYAVKDGVWKRIQPPGGAKEGEAAALFLFDLLSLKWEKLLKPGKEYDLEHPRLEILVTEDAGGKDGKGPKVWRLSLAGPDEASGLVPARLAGDPRVFGVNPQILRAAP